MSADDELASMLKHPKEMWKPTLTGATQMEQFRAAMAVKHGLPPDVSAAAFWEWSVTHLSEFWAGVWELGGLVASQPWREVVDLTTAMADVPQWFSGARMNFAENLLAHGAPDATAVVQCGEGQLGLRRVTYGELRAQVGRMQGALRAAGLQQGDRVAGYVPNSLEAVVCMLAVTASGAVWTSTSPDFGVSGVLDRFTQVAARFVVSCNAVHYNGKTHSHFAKLRSVVDGLATAGVAPERVIVFPHVEPDRAPDDFERSVGELPGGRGVTWDAFLATAPPAAAAAVQGPTFVQLPPAQPVYILYSSGTTGKPKCIVHGAVGTLVQHAKEHRLGCDLRPADVLFYYTTCGWMMWNWLVGALATGCTLVLYDGSPFAPGAATLWDLAAELRVTVFGTSAKYLQVLEAKNYRPAEAHPGLAQHLRMVLSTGSPLLPQSFDFVYQHVAPRCNLGSITGGTDIISCFAGNNPTTPVYRGEIQGRNLGMAVYAFDERGEPVLDARGELVCVAPFPCMPVHFWADEGGARYRKAYFERFPASRPPSAAPGDRGGAVWAHGDYVVVNSRTGGIHMLGRSDAVLNPGGVRFGSAELYNVVETALADAVEDSLAVGQQHAGDERVILFLKMVPGVKFGPGVVDRVRGAIRQRLSARHVPAVILPTSDIPYTISGKKVEIAVKDLLHGRPVHNRSALRNPESLDLYVNLVLEE